MILIKTDKISQKLLSFFQKTTKFQILHHSTCGRNLIF
jgi:hypothetical protein